jgi:hypothetical protein
MRTSALARSLGAGAVLASAVAGLQGGCVTRTTAAKIDAADASSTQDAMLPADLADADSAGNPSNTDTDGVGANDDAMLDEANPTEAAPDASGDADSATDCTFLTPTECLLESKRGSVCRICAESQCAAANLQCEHFAGNAAVSGPAAGQPRQDLCLEALSCILTTKCYLYGAGVDACYCGSEGRASCSDGGPAPNAARFCVSAEQNGLETTDPGVAIGSLTNTDLGAGTANALQLCLEVKCSTSKCL